MQNPLKQSVASPVLKEQLSVAEDENLFHLFSDEWRFAVLAIICGMFFWGLLAGFVVGSKTLINGQYWYFAKSQTYSQSLNVTRVPDGEPA